MFDGSWTVISSAYFCGSSIVDSVCLGDTRLAITFSSSPLGLFGRDGVPTTVVSDVQLNWDSSGCSPITLGLFLGEQVGLPCLGVFLGEQRGLPCSNAPTGVPPK